MKILIACECSQKICKEFRRLGVECYSCDLEEQYGGHPEWHIKRNCLDVMCGDCTFKTQDGEEHYVDAWDCVIAHPPCTYLCRAQFCLYNRKRFGDKYVDDRLKKQRQAIDFFMKFTELNCPTLIENPIGIMSRLYKPASQVIEPYMFGDAATKATCLWLHDLPRLIPTNIVGKGKKHEFPNSNAVGDWYYRTSCLPHSERARARSETFPGIAKAIAYQYFQYLKYWCGKDDEEEQK